MLRDAWKKFYGGLVQVRVADAWMTDRGDGYFTLGYVIRANKGISGYTGPSPCLSVGIIGRSGRMNMEGIGLLTYAEIGFLMTGKG